MIYNSQDILVDLDSRKYYGIKSYSSIPLAETDIYVITNVGDSLTGLAYTYYYNTKLWKIISIANNNITAGSMFPIPGTQLRIPIDISSILDQFQ